MVPLSNFSENEISLVSISSLILRHLLQTICNAHAITELKDNGNSIDSTLDREQIRYATAIYPRVSLLNHACNSNVLSSFNENSSVIVVKSARSIKKNDEVFNCYGPHYLKMGFIERRQALMEQYHFECSCQACMDQINKSVSDCNKAALKCFQCKSATDVYVEMDLGQLSKYIFYS